VSSSDNVTQLRNSCSDRDINWHRISVT